MPTLTPIQRMHHAVQSSNVGALADLLKIYQPTKDELQELLHIAVTSFDPATVTLLLNQPTKLSFYPQGKEPLLTSAYHSEKWFKVCHEYSQC